MEHAESMANRNNNKSDGNNITTAIGDDKMFRPHFDDAFVVTVWTLMLIYAFTANILVLIGIFRSHSLLKATSYWLIVSLSICDVFMIIISLIHIVPATLWHERFVETMSWRNIWALFFYDLFWYTGVLKLGLMAGNRFVSIVYPNAYQRVFSRDRTLQIIGLVYLAGLAVSVPTLFPCCHTVYNSRYYVTMYVPPDTLYSYVDIAVNSVSLLVMIVCYGVIIWKVRESRRALARYKNATLRSQTQNSAVATVMLAATTAGTHSGAAGSRSFSATAAVIGGSRNNKTERFNGRKRGASTTVTQYSSIQSKKNNDSGTNHRPPRRSVSKRETRLFLQFFLVSMVFLLTWATWQWLPRISESKWIFFLLTSLFFINNGVNPTVYLIFNSTLRREVVRTVCGKASSSNYLLGAVHRRFVLHAGGGRGEVEETTEAEGSAFDRGRDRKCWDQKQPQQQKRLGSRAARESCQTRDSATTSSSQPCRIRSSCVGTSKISDNSHTSIPIKQLVAGGAASPTSGMFEKNIHWIPPMNASFSYQNDSDDQPSFQNSDPAWNELNSKRCSRRRQTIQYRQGESRTDSKVRPIVVTDDSRQQLQQKIQSYPEMSSPDGTTTSPSEDDSVVHGSSQISSDDASPENFGDGTTNNNNNNNVESWHFLTGDGLYSSTTLDTTRRHASVVGHRDITLMEHTISKDDIVVVTSTV